MFRQGIWVQELIILVIILILVIMNFDRDLVVTNQVLGNFRDRVGL